MEGGHDTARTLLGLTSDPQWSPYSGQPNPVAAAATPARAGVITLALLLGGSRVGWTGTFGGTPPPQRDYFAVLQRWGATRSVVELLVLGDEAPTPPDDAVAAAEPAQEDEPGTEVGAVPRDDAA